MWRIFERLSPCSLRAGSSVSMATERCNRGGTRWMFAVVR
ncbi:hypothetical protein AH4AK4_0446 [Aeromonas hydrophila 4AK4]|nr:hypothetical protein AH4AK4_0446 [Aeromonas hydrophila 4AK4]